MNTPAWAEPRTSPRCVVRTRPLSMLRACAAAALGDSLPLPPPPPQAASSKGTLTTATQAARRVRQVEPGCTARDDVFAFNVVSLHTLLGGNGFRRGNRWRGRPHRRCGAQRAQATDHAGGKVVDREHEQQAQP